MDSSTLALLILFNLLIWWIILSGLINLARRVNRLVAVTFAVGMLFQGIHSLILPFSDRFQKFLPSMILNPLETTCAAISAFLLYYTAVQFWDYAISAEDDENIYSERSIFKPKISARTLFIGVILAILVTFIFEMRFAGEISNTITPSTTDIKHNPFLLISRFVIMGYIVGTELFTAYIFYQILKTSYGQRHSVRTTPVIASVLTHTSHFAVNLLVTIIIFLANEHILQKSIQEFYLKFDTIILIPLGISFLFAVGPSLLITQIENSILIIRLMQYRRRIIWLRNLLLHYYPTIELPVSFQSPSRWNPVIKLKYEVTRYTIECSDALHLLLKSMVINEQSVQSLVEEKDVVKTPGAEAFLIAEALENSRKKFPITQEGYKRLSNLSVFKAKSLQELYRIYADIATQLDKKTIRLDIKQ